MASVEPKVYMGVDGLLGMLDRYYELHICDKCASDCHAECGGKKSKLTIAGTVVLGECQCPSDAHNSLRKGKVDAENSGS